MHKKSKCKCGSSKVVYVVRKGRRKELQSFCERCLPVEKDEKETYVKSGDHLKKT